MELKGKVAEGLVNSAHSNATVIAAGPLTLQPHSKAYRVVLTKWGSDQLTVHNEYFDVEGVVEDLQAACSQAKSYFEAGSYFKPHEMVAATVEFAERVKRYSGPIESIYRPAA